MAPEVIAVVGTCAPERQEYARWLVPQRGAILLQAERITKDASAVEGAIGLAGKGPGGQALVVEYPDQIPALHVIGEIVDGEQPAVLTDVICVVDAAHLIEDLTSAEQIPLAQPSADGGAAIVASRAELAVTQIEYASAVVLVNTEHMNAEELGLALSLVSHLAPKAHLDLRENMSSPHEGSELGSFSEEQGHAGWLCLLNSDFAPRFEHPRVTALHYEQLRPLHPGRLAEVMQDYLAAGGTGILLRSAGFAHLATRSHITAHWNQAGEHLTLTPAGFDHQLDVEDEPLAFGQDLALIGFDIDEEELRGDLDAAALTDRELAAGPQVWASFVDPFPGWVSAG